MNIDEAPCKACCYKIPANATRCRHCGADQQPVFNFFNRNAVILSALVAVLGAVFSVFSSSSANEDRNEAADILERIESIEGNLREREQQAMFLWYESTNANIKSASAQSLDAYYLWMQVSLECEAFDISEAAILKFLSERSESVHEPSEYFTQAARCALSKAHSRQRVYLQHAYFQKVIEHISVFKAMFESMMSGNHNLNEEKARQLYAELDGLINTKSPLEEIRTEVCRQTKLRSGRNSLSLSRAIEKFVTTLPTSELGGRSVEEASVILNRTIDRIFEQTNRIASQSYNRDLYCVI